MRGALFEYATKRGFRDPLTDCFPSSERDLSGLLCLYAQRQAISWSKVPLYNCATFDQVESGTHLLRQPGSFLSEYVLPAKDEREGGIWGSMPVDLLYISDDLASVVMFENKIGGRVGYEAGPETSQLARQLEFMVSLRRNRVQSAALVLISARTMFEKQWYRQEFADALAHNSRCAEVSGYLMTWEDLFDATAVEASAPT